MKSGDKIQTLAGTTVEAPYANEHPCFGQRQGWCTSLATWRMETPHLMLHWCDACKQRPNLQSADQTWTRLETRPGTNAFPA